MLDKLERKFGRYAIPHLMRYIIFGTGLVYAISFFYPNILYLLNLDPAYVMKGQIWRIFTFILVPSSRGIMTILSLFCYYWIGDALERTLGTFKFNLYYLIGWFCLAVTMFIFYFAFHIEIVMVAQMSYFNQSLFIALATLFPDISVLLFFFIPVKGKWIGWISAALILVEFVLNGFPLKMLILASFVPYIIYFLPGLIRRWKAYFRRRDYQKKASGAAPRMSKPYSQSFGNQYRGTQNVQRNPQGMSSAAERGKIINDVAFHRCAVCGLTELDDPNMSFRYCSQCNGNYEYCENHIHNHTHVQ